MHSSSPGTGGRRSPPGRQQVDRRRVKHEAPAAADIAEYGAARAPRIRRRSQSPAPRGRIPPAAGCAPRSPTRPPHATAAGSPSRSWREAAEQDQGPEPAVASVGHARGQPTRARLSAAVDGRLQDADARQVPVALVVVEAVADDGVRPGMVKPRKSIGTSARRRAAVGAGADAEPMPGPCGKVTEQVEGEAGVDDVLDDDKLGMGCDRSPQPVRSVWCRRKACSPP